MIEPLGPNLAIKLAVRSLRWRIANINRDRDPARADEWYADFNQIDAEVRGDLRAIGYPAGEEIDQQIENVSAQLSSDMMKLVDVLYKNSPSAGKDPSHPWSNLDIDWTGTNVKPIK